MTFLIKKTDEPVAHVFIVSGDEENIRVTWEAQIQRLI